MCELNRTVSKAVCGSITSVDWLHTAHECSCSDVTCELGVRQLSAVREDTVLGC